jgi:hypothetical protein
MNSTLSISLSATAESTTMHSKILALAAIGMAASAPPPQPCNCNLKPGAPPGFGPYCLAANATACSTTLNLTCACAGPPANTTVRCSVFDDRDVHSRMLLSFTPLLHLKRCHACDQWHSFRVSTHTLTVATVNSAQTLKGCNLRPGQSGIYDPLCAGQKSEDACVDPLHEQTCWWNSPPPPTPSDCLGAMQKTCGACRLGRQALVACALLSGFGRILHSSREHDADRAESPLGFTLPNHEFTCHLTTTLIGLYRH